MKAGSQAVACTCPPALLPSIGQIVFGHGVDMFDYEPLSLLQARSAFTTAARVGQCPSKLLSIGARIAHFGPPEADFVRIRWARQPVGRRISTPQSPN